MWSKCEKEGKNPPTEPNTKYVGGDPTSKGPEQTPQSPTVSSQCSTNTIEDEGNAAAIPKTAKCPGKSGENNQQRSPTTGAQCTEKLVHRKQTCSADELAHVSKYYTARVRPADQQLAAIWCVQLWLVAAGRTGWPQPGLVILPELVALGWVATGIILIADRSKGIKCRCTEFTLSSTYGQGTSSCTGKINQTDRHYWEKVNLSELFVGSGRRSDGPKDSSLRRPVKQRSGGLENRWDLLGVSGGRNKVDVED
ncbi:hypothetical protein FB45DRAFT_1007413 [Roridomyces roridus]|uniref:Uncharacterized protein n=1 Tax=Roridomyces roridus TaxID=1738132 RepID=A0AAD7BEU1_9AGAR|nr:hypothetical protein FB45DRAFT_1007413 [Roridomyces roridus]